MPPKVSVIVPNYNHARFLRQRLDSIFNQTFQDFEVIILDDCSTDNSKEVIEEYRNRSQVSHIVYNETNSGSPFKQWAKGFDLAQGEYIWIAESDDWAELNFLDVLTDILRKDDQLGLVYCESYWEYPNKSIAPSIVQPSSRYNGIEFIKTKQIINNNIVNASSVIFCKEFLHQIKTDFQEFKGSGDYLFWSYLCEVSDLYYCNLFLNHFRQHHSKTTNKCIANGTSFFENHQIYTYFLNKGYISEFGKYLAISYVLSEIREHKNDLKKNNAYELSRVLWSKELKLDTPKSWFLFSKAIYINEYKYLSLLGIIWKFFHLPDTNIRKIFHKKKEK